MDHITQLYQNRAKVLQEEVTRLEALLEAVKDIDLGKIENVPGDPSRSLSAPTSGGSKKKKDEEPSGLTDQQIAQAQYARNLEAAGTILPQLVYGVGGKALEYWMPLTGIVGTELLAKKLSGKTMSGRAFDIIKGMREQAKQAKQAEVAEIARKAAAEKQTQSALRIAKDIKPGEVDPTLGVLRRPESEIPVGKVGSLTPAGREKIAQVIQSTGDELAPETKELIRAKPGETHKYLRSIGAITPEDIEAAGQGVKDIAMTGKEVGKRTKDLARGALGVAGKGLKIVDAITDPLSAAGEAIGLSSLSAVAPEVVGGLAMAPFAIGAFTSEAGKGSDIVAPTEEEIKARQDWANEQRKQQGLAPVDSIASPTSAVDAASLGAVTVSQQDRAKLERQAMGAKTSTPNLDRIQKQREMLKLLQSGPRMFGGGVK